MHGTHDTVNRILDHKDIKAISFVGSDAAGRYIYERGSASGKRVQVICPMQPHNPTKVHFSSRERVHLGWCSLSLTSVSGVRPATVAQVALF